MPRGEQGIVEKDPGFVENEKRRSAVEALLEPMEEIGQHWQDDSLLVHQLLHLETLHVGERETAFGGVEQTAERAIERIGHQRRFERVRLDEDGEARERALVERRRSEIG
jgi:hypothetical protein